jgi:hypothetical protein
MAHPKRTEKPHRGARRPRRYCSPSMRLISTPRRPRAPWRIRSERKSRTVEPAVPGGTVLPPCALSAHRGDRGLHGASEANGKAAPWSPPSPAVPFSLHAPYQHTAETAAPWRIRSERKSRTVEPAVPGGTVLPPCALSAHRGDRGLHGASEANGKAAPWSPPSPAVPFSLPAPYPATLAVVRLQSPPVPSRYPPAPLPILHASVRKKKTAYCHCLLPLPPATSRPLSPLSRLLPLPNATAAALAAAAGPLGRRLARCS